MAPQKWRSKNYDIRSESWIDLSRIVNSVSPPSVNKSNFRATNNDANSASSTLERSYLATTRRSNSVQVDQQHLLIRLRQQSYLNRSSASLLSSNLSNSIDLTSSLADFYDEPPDDHCWRTSRRCATTTTNESELLKREPTKLRLLRDKFQRRGRKLYLEVRDAAAASPSTRSLTSSIGDKLTDIRHSWKQFLYKYGAGAGGHKMRRRHQLSQNRLGDDDEQARGAECSEQLQRQRRLAQAASISRLRMTDEWIARYQQQLLEPTWSPCESSSSSNSNSNSNKQRVYSGGQHQARVVESRLSQRQQLQSIRGRSQPPDNERYLRLEDRRHLEREARRHRPSWTSQDTPDADDDDDDDNATRKEHAVQERQVSASRGRTQIDTSSSTTLVSSSRPLSQSPALTFVSSSSSSSASSSAAAKPSTPTVERLNSRKPTSDYSRSSATSSSQESKSDYPSSLGAKRLAQGGRIKILKTDKLLEEDQQQQVMQQAAAQRSKQPLPPVPDVSCGRREAAPLLLLNRDQEQEYYLDVLANSGQPNQASSELIGGAGGGHLPTLLSLDQMTEYDDDDYAVPADESSYRLEQTQVELVQLIGEGQKGYVFLGKLQSRDGARIEDVAIKTLKYETPQLIGWLLREASMMRQLDHPHIIRFIGVCPESPALIAMELAQFGELRQYLRAQQPLLSVSQLILFTFQLSTALSFLESKQFVHRDVAARNVLVCGQNCVKLADFGLTRSVQTLRASFEDDPMLASGGGGQYVAAARGKLPVRWLAPESLAFRRFTSASDVWMFAVCSWEMFHFGALRPWAQIRNKQVLAAIESGERLAQPPNCPARLYELLLQCWAYAPVQRPKFRELKQNLWSIYLNERAREQLELEQQQHQQQQLHEQRILLHLQQQRELQALQARDQQQQQQYPAQARHNHRYKVAEPAQQSSFAGGLVAPEARLTTPRVSVRPRPSREQNLLALGASSPLNLSYGSNVSGYSSATAADFSSSHNSSRSSSMGSLARRQQQQQQQQLRAGRLASGQQQELRAKLSPGATNQTATDAKEDASKRQRTRFESNVEQNMKRFQRPAGQMLQRQRSQGSIAQPSQRPGDRSQVLGKNLFYGYDDAALLNGGRTYLHSARPTSHQLGGDPFDQINAKDAEDESDSDADADGQAFRDPADEEDYLSADERLAAARYQESRRKPRPPPATRSNPRLRPSAEEPLQLKRRADEPTYEGLLASGPEVFMVRGDLSVIEQQRSDTQRPASNGGAATTDSMEREQRLSDVLQSLRLSPMKARLSSRSSASPASERQSSLEPRAQVARQRPEASAAKIQLPQCVASNESVAAESVEQQQRQLALHQRLLGHIRPPPTGQSRSDRFSEQRRSMNIEQQQQQQPINNTAAQNSRDAKGLHRNQTKLQQCGGSSVEKVDQSLQILESLISEKGFSADQQQQQLQMDLVNHHEQNLKRQLQQPAASAEKRTNPAQQFVDFFVRRKQQM